MSMTDTPVEFSFATSAELGGVVNYRHFCRVAGLHPISGGWGMLHCVGGDGKHVTHVTTDVEYLRALVQAGPLAGGLEIPVGKFPLSREGWPDEWVIPEGTT
jgi:hypothetical protein